MKKCIAFIDRSILKAFVVYGLPFHIIENPYFINMIKNLRLNYNPLTREILLNKLLPEETIRVELKIKNSLEQSNNLTLGIVKIIFLFNYYVYTILIFFNFKNKDLMVGLILMVILSIILLLLMEIKRSIFILCVIYQM